MQGEIIIKILLALLLVLAYTILKIISIGALMGRPRNPENIPKPIPVGRPTLYDKKMLKVVTKMCLLGCTNVDIAKSLDISEATFKNYMNAYPEFLAAIKKGRDDADAAVSHALFQRATGYSQTETHVAVVQGVITKTSVRKKYPPSEIAQFFWLKNRRKDLWKPDSLLTPLGGAPEDLTAALLKLAEKLPV